VRRIRRSFAWQQGYRFAAHYHAVPYGTVLRRTLFQALRARLAMSKR
jgi:hypothetical protein